ACSGIGTAASMARSAALERGASVGDWANAADAETVKKVAATAIRTRSKPVRRFESCRISHPLGEAIPALGQVRFHSSQLRQPRHRRSLGTSARQSARNGSRRWRQRDDFKADGTHEHYTHTIPAPSAAHRTSRQTDRNIACLQRGRWRGDCFSWVCHRTATVQCSGDVVSAGSASSTAISSSLRYNVERPIFSRRATSDIWPR
ncbi:MAG: hypothetical protein JWQ51_1596, partial [Tardiphaga sp.]|nr:hypothetical protein [Tardiphaga sp.]